MTKTAELRQQIASELKNIAPTSIVSLVNNIIELAYCRNASDIHIDPTATSVRIRLRIDGILQEETELPSSIQSEVISRIKILASLRTDEHQTAQDGRFCVSLESGAFDVRVSIAPTYYGENAVLRILTDQHQAFNFDELGFLPSDTEKILRSLRHPNGMILATGPTGSGKTTTLYTLVKLLKNSEQSIITIEDPIEYSIDGISQMGVNAKTGFSFANGLRSILRQDPNIIMVGEIRDRETAGLAINAALTGHLVLSTVHTNDAATTLPRFIDLGIEPYLIASTVTLVIAQRLVRKICQDCKQKVDSNPAKLTALQEAIPATISQNFISYQGSGCQNCNYTGYRGRISIHEILAVDPIIRQAIHQKSSAAEIKRLAQDRGMTTMVEDGFSKAQLGITTVQEVLRTFHA